MTAFNKTFLMYAGERKNLIIPVDDMADLSGYTISFSLMENEDSTVNLVSKQSPVITTSGNTITVPLLKVDTSTLLGTYYYECEIIDGSGEFSTVAVGNITIKK